MPKGYWIARVDVEDAEAYPQYIKTALPAYERFGGKFLVRGGKVHDHEGQMRTRNVVIEFPSIEAALECYHCVEYTAAKKIRQANSRAEVIVIEGH